MRAAMEEMTPAIFNEKSITFYKEHSRQRYSLCWKIYNLGSVIVTLIGRKSGIGKLNSDLHLVYV